MPRDFTIENYKLFRALRLPRLGDVNLIVGRNNTGKTILLEALMLHAAQGHPSRIFEVLWSRDEILRVGSEHEPRSRREAAVRLEALFHGIPESVEGASLELASMDPAKSLKIVGKRAVSMPLDKAQFPLQLGESTPGSEEVAALEVHVGGAFQYLADLPLLSRITRVPKDNGGAVFVAIGGLAERDIASWWDALTLTDGEQGVYECLRLLAPVERLSLVERPDLSSTRMAMVKLRGQARPVPLRSLGDGVRRVFQFALALQKTRPGDLLLLDEVENGVHYSALPSLWSFIIKAARAKQVQVFATTHSWDCVVGFQKATAQDSAPASLIKLYRDGDGIQASTFDERELDVVTREEVEVR
ncbi:MAG: ATP-binding protein [Polyangiaceae bacterium]|jgi:hypothetical protein|nr:ATP-binding protein [Polyangiaceae bacterium]